jgi:cytochrome P450
MTKAAPAGQQMEAQVSVGLSAAHMSELERLIPGLLGSIVLVMPQLQHDLWPGSPWRRFTARRDAVDAILFDEMARKRADPNLANRSDVLSMLLGATDEDGEHMTDAELRDQLVTLLLAGHETTATALAWTFERLTRNPQVLARLRATLAEDDEDYLECVIKESLRSRPVVSYAMRRTTEPFSVGGYTAPAGAYLGTSVILTTTIPICTRNHTSSDRSDSRTSAPTPTRGCPSGEAPDGVSAPRLPPMR